MQTLSEIEEAIQRLPKKQMFELVERLETKAGNAWDQQIEEDVKAGKLDAIAEQALAEHRAGKSLPFPSNGK
ncbi:MAG: hypothetical protein ACSHYB_17010 [Roseibacillus sp.]